MSVQSQSDCCCSSESRVDGPVLELHKIRKEEAGSYLCIASNGHPPTVSRRVQIDVKCEREQLYIQAGPHD